MLPSGKFVLRNDGGWLDRQMACWYDPHKAHLYNSYYEAYLVKGLGYGNCIVESDEINIHIDHNAAMVFSPNKITRRYY